VVVTWASTWLDATTYTVLGGNQSDSVSITRIAKDRCVARRWPTNVVVVGRTIIARGGGKISTKEA
jgi:hypothetical protein